MTATRRLGPTLLLNALRPKNMVPQPDTSPRLRLRRSPAWAVCKVRAERTTREGDVMLSAGKGVSPVPIVRRCSVPRRFG